MVGIPLRWVDVGGLRYASVWPLGAGVGVRAAEVMVGWSYVYGRGVVAVLAAGGG